MHARAVKCARVPAVVQRQIGCRHQPFRNSRRDCLYLAFSAVITGVIIITASGMFGGVCLATGIQSVQAGTFRFVYFSVLNLDFLAASVTAICLFCFHYVLPLCARVSSLKTPPFHGTMRWHVNIVEGEKRYGVAQCHIQGYKCIVSNDTVVVKKGPPSYPLRAVVFPPSVIPRHRQRVHCNRHTVLPVSRHVLWCIPGAQ